MISLGWWTGRPTLKLRYIKKTSYKIFQQNISHNFKQNNCQYSPLLHVCSMEVSAYPKHAKRNYVFFLDTPPLTPTSIQACTNCMLDFLLDLLWPLFVILQKVWHAWNNICESLNIYLLNGNLLLTYSFVFIHLISYLNNNLEGSQTYCISYFYYIIYGIL